MSLLTTYCNLVAGLTKVTAQLISAIPKTLSSDVFMSFTDDKV